MVRGVKKLVKNTGVDFRR